MIRTRALSVLAGALLALVAVAALAGTASAAEPFDDVNGEMIEGADNPRLDELWYHQFRLAVLRAEQGVVLGGPGNG